MQTFKTHCGGKTFLLGEYGALMNQQGLVLVTKPFFSAEFTRNGKAKRVNAPCARFVAQHADVLADIGYRFYDPYNGLGGLGASSAEFVFWLRALAFYSEGPTRCLDNTADWCTVLDWYRDTHWCGHGIAPSGVDMVAQNKQGLVWVDIPNGIATTLEWPFPDMGLCLLHTGQKLATHTHLTSLHDVSNMTGLSELSRCGYEAVRCGDRSAFLRVIRRAAKQLNKSGLLAPWSNRLLNELQQESFTLAAKGCGAMGADVILICYPLVEQQHVIAWARDRQLPMIAIHALAEEMYAAE